MEFDYEKFFNIHSTIMRMNRCHPEIPRDRKWLLTFFVIQSNFTLAFVLIIYNIIYDLKMDDIFKACKDGTFMGVYIVNTSQYLIMLWKQDLLKGLMDTMKEDYVQIRDSKIEDQEMLFKNAQNAVWVTKVWFLLCTYGAFMFPAKTIVLYIYYYFVGAEFTLIPLYELVYPGLIDEKKDTSLFVYFLLYVFLLNFAFYSGTMYASFVPLGSIFMLHACGRIEILTRRMENLFVHQEGEEVVDELKSIIMELQKIYNFANRIDDAFRVAYDVTLKTTSVIMPITVYEALEAFSAREVSLEFITFIVGCVLITSSPCYYSEKLMDKGEEFRLAVYNCGWERHYDRRVRSTIVLILHRALRPLALHTMFRTICLDALTEVYHQAYAIFNLMNTMWN